MVDNAGVFELRRNLQIDGQTLCLPDPGESAMVVMRYKGVELAFVVSPEHLDHDECVIRPMLKMRDLIKEVTNV